MRLRDTRLALPLAAAIAAGCSRAAPEPPSSAPAQAPAAPAPTALRAVTPPDLSALSPAVREQLSTAADDFKKRTADERVPASVRAEAYGEYGILLMAAGFHSQAEPSFLNAETLAPSELRWPYYLAHIYRRSGRLPDSTAAFERALRADPTYVPALVWLGNSYLDQSRLDDAAAQFERAIAASPDEPAAAFGLGRVATARGDFARAAAQFERTLSLDPAAVAAHYPLSQAYRQLGDAAKAQAHLKREVSGGEIRPRDPLDVHVMVEAAVGYEVRGGRALQNGDWTSAVDAFKRAVDLSPEDPALRHKYGTALALSGDQAAALREMRTVTRRWPTFAKAQYSLALMLLDRRDVSGAIEAFRRAIRATPTFAEARLQLAHTLRRSGQPADAIPEYERALELDPRIGEARFGRAMALVSLKRFTDARDQLTEALTLHPEEAGFQLALARLLSASPDASVRDGVRAIAVLDTVPADKRRIEWGVVRGMALAEAGRFDEATRIQQAVITSLERNGSTALANNQREALRSYEQKQPVRIPWRPDEAMELPDSGIVPTARR